MTENTATLLWAGLLVNLMAIGFALFTAGVIRAKSNVTLLTSVVFAFVIANLVYLGIGYQLMFLGKANTNPYIPTLAHFPNFGSHWTLFLTQKAKAIKLGQAFFHASLVFLALTIIACSLSERLKLWSFFWFAIIFAGGIYPMVGYWTNVDGFLYHKGFIDQCNISLIFLSTAIATLVGLPLIGARVGKYKKNPRKIVPILASNMPLAFLGAMLFLLGSFGLASVVGANQIDLAVIWLNLIAAACASTLVVIILTELFHGKIDITLLLNAIMIGIVAICAKPTHPNLMIASIIGAIAGVIGLFTMVLFDKLTIDDPSGGMAIFSVGAIWGLIAESLTPSTFLGLQTKQLGIQIQGILAIILWVAVTSFIVWSIIKFIIGLRLSKEQEIQGIDIQECGVTAYPE